MRKIAAALVLACALLMIGCPPPYKPPAIKPDPNAARVVAKIVNGAPPAFEPGEDPAKSYFVVTPAFILYLAWLQQENREQALTIEKLRAIVEGKK